MAKRKNDRPDILDEFRQNIPRDLSAWANLASKLAQVLAQERADRDRYRDAILDAIPELAAAHGPEWASDKAKADGKDPIWCRTCGAHDGSWPCTTAMVADDLRAALDGEDPGDA